MNMLRKDSFIQTPNAATAFITLKKDLSTTPMLALPKFTKEFVVEYGVSNRRLGTVLSRKPSTLFLQ